MASRLVWTDYKVFDTQSSWRKVIGKGYEGVWTFILKETKICQRLLSRKITQSGLKFRRVTQRAL